MSNKKATKRALLTSILAICLCLVMLIGSTFAWFTDTASTSVNSIQSGTLKVDLEMSKDGGANWESTRDKVLQFKVNGAFPTEETQILWEPGCTYELPMLRVINKGNLALKYKVAITGIDGDAELNQVIDWTIDEKPIDLTEGHLIAGTAENPSVSESFTIKGHMQETAGNDYMNKSITGIAITVYATQDTVENDSYGPDYDRQAGYATDAADLDGVTVGEDGTLVFTKNVDLTGQPDSSDQTKITKDATVDFAEYKLTGTLQNGGYKTDDPIVNVTIKGNAADGEYNIQANYSKSSTGVMKQAAAIQVYKPTTTVESGKYSGTNNVLCCQVQGVYAADGTQWKWKAVNPDPLPTDFMTALVVKGGQFDAYNNGSVVAAIIGKVIIEDGTFNALGDGSECVYVKPGDSNQETSVTINGGTFNSNNNMFVLKNGSKTALVTVNGGTFTLNSEAGSLMVGEGTLIINGGTFNVDPSAYVDTTTHTVTESNGTWTVTAK